MICPLCYRNYWIILLQFWRSSRVLKFIPKAAIIVNYSRVLSLVSLYNNCFNLQNLVITHSVVNEHSVIMNRFYGQIGHFTSQINPVITNKIGRSRAVHYNRVWLYLKEYILHMPLWGENVNETFFYCKGLIRSFSFQWKFFCPTKGGFLIQHFLSFSITSSISFPL